MRFFLRRLIHAFLLLARYIVTTTSSAYLSGFYSCETHYRKSDNVIEQSPFSYLGDEDSGVLKRYEYVFLVAPSKAGDLTITFSATPEYPDSLVVYGIGATPVDFVFQRSLGF
jgi:hypothetical protein